MGITHTSFTKILQRDYGDVFVRLISNKNFSDLLIEIDSISELASESNNRYPMLILTPGQIVLRLSISDIINDAINNNDLVISTIHNFLCNKGYTKRY